MSIVLLAALALSAHSHASASDLDGTLALDPGPAGAAATARVLAAYHERSDGESGFAWWMRLPIAVRSRHAQDVDVRRWRNRVEFLRDTSREDATACAMSGPPALDDPALECGFAVELGRWLDCLSMLPPQRRAQTIAVRAPAAASRLARDATRCPDIASIRSVRLQLDSIAAAGVSR